MADGVNDPAWVRQVVGRYERPLLSYALRLLGGGGGGTDLSRARDVVQETFAKLCHGPPADLNGHLGPWLYTVCRNAAMDVRRKERRVTTMADSAAERLQSAAAQPDEVAERNDSRSHVLKVLSRLPANQQEVIRLKFQHGMSYRQISQITGHSESNVGFLIHAGIKALRERMSGKT